MREGYEMWLKYIWPFSRFNIQKNNTNKSTEQDEDRNLNNFSFKCIECPICTDAYVLHSLHYDSLKTGRLSINLWHAIGFECQTVTMTFDRVLAIRSTPLNVCATEYSNKILKYSKTHPDALKEYRGVLELTGNTQFKSNVCKEANHYLIITEDEYIEVISDRDFVVQCFDNRKST
jgi:hypothetical protein